MIGVPRSAHITRSSPENIATPASGITRFRWKTATLTPFHLMELYSTGTWVIGRCICAAATQTLFQSSYAPDSEPHSPRPPRRIRARRRFDRKQRCLALRLRSRASTSWKVWAPSRSHSEVPHRLRPAWMQPEIFCRAATTRFRRRNSCDRGLTNHWSQPLAAVLSRSNFMREFLMFATLAAASGGSVRSR